MRTLGVIAAALVLMTGCRHEPLTYQVARQGPTTLLIPPRQPASEAGFAIKVRHATKTARSGCDLDDQLIRLRWKGTTAEATLKPGGSAPATANGTANQAQRLPALSLASPRDTDAARADVLTLATKGCLTSQEDERLRLALVEHFPLLPDAGHVFLFGDYGFTGVFDLTSDFRLHIIGPVYAPGSSVSTSKPTGYETTDYVFAGPGGDRRVTMSLSSVTETQLGRTEGVQKSAPQNALPFPRSLAYFRLLFRNDLSSSNHSATIISAGDETQLNEATRLRESGPVDSCEGVSVQGATCTTFGAAFGVNAEMRVRVNGREVFVRVGGTVRDAIELRRPAAAPPNLMVRRLYQGRLIPITFDPASQDILGLVLMPGDEITVE